MVAGSSRQARNSHSIDKQLECDSGEERRGVICKGTQTKG